MHTFALTLALAGVVAAALPPQAFAGVVGTSIGADLVIDDAFGDQGFTVVSYNDDYGVWDESVRIAAAENGGFWLFGFHRPSSGDDRVAISKLDADGLLDPSFGEAGRIAATTGLTWVRDGLVANGR